MTMFGDRTPSVAPALPVPAASPASVPASKRPTSSRPPWWCAHRSRSAAIGVLLTAVLVCLAAGIAVVGFVSVGSTIAALVALVVLAVGAANVVSGSFGAAWWARRASTSPEVTSMTSTDGPHPSAADQGYGPPRPAPVVPAARAPRTPPHGGGRHAAREPLGDEPTTQIPANPPPPNGPPPGLRPVPTVGPPAPPAPDGADSSAPTEALPAQSPEEPSTTSTTPRVAAKRAAARPPSKIKRVAGRRA